MARPIRFAPVLEGDEAIELVERVKAMENVPLKRVIPKEEERKIIEFFRRYELDKLNRAL